MKEKVLITGASGFVGFHLIETALKNNLDVYAAIRKSSDIKHLEHLPIQFTYPDYTDLTSLTKELKEKQYDYIIHAAGVTRARSEQEYDDINAGYTFNLASAVIKSGINLKKFVLISSLAALGPLTDIAGVITEETIANPVTAYGKSKLKAEEHLKTFGNLNYTILRPTGVYGPLDKDIFIFFKQLVNGIEPYIGKMEQRLSLIYVNDLAKAALLALYAGNQKAYNLSDGNFYGRYDLGDATKSFLKIKPLKIHLPVNLVFTIAWVSEKVSSLKNKAAVLNIEKLKELMAVSWYCNIDKAKADLKFKADYDLDAGVAETLIWYKENKWL